MYGKIARMTTALITGATAGLGWAFAQRLAADGHDLVLVARDEARLSRRAGELSERFGVQVEVMPADLSRSADTSRVAARVGDADLPIDLLVNNAGFGMTRRFSTSDLADELRLLDVLCRAVLVLSHAAVPVMRGRGRGAILNVSSVAGFAAMGTYSAAKAWVTSFSESLAAELAGSGVRVSAVCPGFIHTEFHARAELKMGYLPEVAWLDADSVAAEALADLRRGVVVSVPSLRYKVFTGGLRYVPSTLRRRVSATISRRRTKN